MRSRKERALWTLLAIVLIAAATTAWWTAERWTPHAEPWARQTWRSMTRPSPPPGHVRSRTATTAADSAKAGASAPAAPPRKCVQGGRTVYTDQACPPGSEERPLDPAVSVLPQ